MTVLGHALVAGEAGQVRGEREDRPDPNREIRLAFLPFALQDAPGQQ